MPGTAAHISTSLKPTPKEVDDFVFAAADGKVVVISEFLDKYGTGFIDEKSTWGYTALMCAAAGGGRNKDAVVLLLERGADIEVMSVSGSTALMCAELQKRADIADLLRQWPKDKERKELEDRERRERAAAAATAKLRMGRLERLRPSKHFLKKQG